MNQQEFKVLWEVAREYENPGLEQQLVAKMETLGRLPLSWQFSLAGIEEMVIQNHSIPWGRKIKAGEGMLWPRMKGWLLILGEADDWDTVGHELAHAVIGRPKSGNYRIPPWAEDDGYVEALCDTAAFRWLNTWRSVGCPR